MNRSKMNRSKIGAWARSAASDSVPDDANTRLTPFRPARAVCTGRLAAITDEQVLRTTWVDGLRDLSAHLERAARGVDMKENLDEAGSRLSILFGVLRTMSYESPCCLGANLNNVGPARCLNALRRAGWAFQEAYQPMGPGRDPVVRKGLIRTVLKAVPEEGELSEIVGDLRVPFCACPDCEKAYSQGHFVFECRHCHSILKASERTIIPLRHRLSL